MSDRLRWASVIERIEQLENGLGSVGCDVAVLRHVTMRSSEVIGWLRVLERRVKALEEACGGTSGVALTEGVDEERVRV